MLTPEVIEVLKSGLKEWPIFPFLIPNHFKEQRSAAKYHFWRPLKDKDKNIPTEKRV